MQHASAVNPLECEVGKSEMWILMCKNGKNSKLLSIAEPHTMRWLSFRQPVRESVLDFRLRGSLIGQRQAAVPSSSSPRVPVPSSSDHFVLKRR
jgi:hypothetical protein